MYTVFTDIARSTNSNVIYNTAVTSDSPKQVEDDFLVKKQYQLPLALLLLVLEINVA